MQESIDIQSMFNNAEEIKTVPIHFDKKMSHYGCLFQAITGLAKKGFADEKEIIEEWHTLLSVELTKK